MEYNFRKKSQNSEKNSEGEVILCKAKILLKRPSCQVVCVDVKKYLSAENLQRTSGLKKSNP